MTLTNNLKKDEVFCQFNLNANKTKKRRETNSLLLFYSSNIQISSRFLYFSSRSSPKPITKRSSIVLPI